MWKLKLREVGDGAERLNACHVYPYSLGGASSARGIFSPPGLPFPAPFRSHRLVLIPMDLIARSPTRMLVSRTEYQSLRVSLPLGFLTFGLRNALCTKESRDECAARMCDEYGKPGTLFHTKANSCRTRSTLVEKRVYPSLSCSCLA